jgi:hypothetical protein
MKKKCTPQNNAITIKTPVCCPEPIAPIVDGCVDPFTYTWNMAINQAILDDTMSVLGYFDKLMDLGQVLSNASNVCCPGCDKTPVYFLGNTETTLKIAEELGWKDSPDRLCCVNVAAGVETNAKYVSNWSSQPPCCQNDFESCLSQFSNIILLSRILEKGVAEINGYDNTLLCTIYNLFINTPEDLFQGATLAEVFDTIIEKGFVSYCCGCNVFIGSTETFLKWWESTEGCGTLFEQA